MGPTPKFRHSVLPVIALLLALAGCTRGRSPASTQAKTELNGPPDLVQDGTRDPRWRAYQLRNFQINHLWAGAGRAAEGEAPYRAKVSLWDYNGGTTPLAELYFHDAGGLPANPDPAKAARPYRIHFPASILAEVLGTLRNANDRVYLYAHDDQWSVGVSMPELVGVD